MKATEVKVGEEFSKNGKKYEKTRDGVKRMSDNAQVAVPKGEVILERQILRG